MNKKYIFIILILLILCASCSNNKINKLNDIDNENNTNNQSIKKDNSEKYKCNISMNAVEKKSFKDAKFLDESFDNYSIEYPNYDHGDGYISSYNIGTNHIFYAVEYIEDMAQLPHKSELYAKDLTTNETELLHYSQGDYTIVNISDICSTSKYVFWIDNKLRGDYQYILKMDLKSKEVSEIIRYEQPITSVNYIDLKISGELLTWFETEELQNGFKVKGMIYNPMTDEILELEPQDMVVTNTWVNTVDNYSTYFTKNDKDEIFINSLDLQSKEIISVLVEGTPNVPYEYSSNEKWLYWLYDGGSNGIYIYNIENNKLYYLDGDDDFTIHSTHLYNNTLYVNAKSEDISSALYKVSLGDMEITGYTSTSIKGNFDTYKSYFKTIDEKVYLYSFGDGKIYITNLE